jgi:DNA repair protein RecO (recombination protein O)
MRRLTAKPIGLNVLVEADTGACIDADAQYLYHLEYGPVLFRGLRDSENVHSGAVQISGACLLLIADESYQSLSANPQFLAELKQLMRYLIAFHLGNKKLKSRELFKPVSKTLSEG